MKRGFLILLLLLPAFLAFGQTTGLESVQSDSSFGVFENQLDAALSVSEPRNRVGFSELENKMIFGGLANLNYDQQIGPPGVTATSTFDAAANDPLWVGMYMPGELPFSLFLAGFYDGAAGNVADYTSTTQQTEPVVDGTTTTNEVWTDFSATYDYTANRLTDNLVKEAQFITSVSGINVGLGLDLDLTDTSPQGSNLVYSETNYYNSAAPGVSPVPEVDYTRSYTQTDFARTNVIGLDVPVFLRTGDLSHFAGIGAEFTTVDSSSTFSETYSDTSQAPLGVVTQQNENDVTETSGNTLVDGYYSLMLPGFFGDDDRNELMAGLFGGVRFRGAEYSTSLEEQDRTYAGGGAAATAGELNRDNFTATIAGRMSSNLGLFAEHTFYYSPAEMVEFGLRPFGSVSFNAFGSDYVLESTTNVDRQDGPGAGTPDGSFDDADDRIITTTTTYTNTEADITTGGPAGGLTETFQIQTNLSAAGSVVVSPEGWPISITLGSQPLMSITNTLTVTKESTTRTSVETVDGTDTTLSTQITEAGTSDETPVWNHTFGISAAHNLGLNMLLGENVRLDVNMNLSSETNILDFSNLVVQAIIELP